MIYYKCTTLLILLLLFVSCNKVETDINSYKASLNVVNAIAGFDTDIKMNFTGGKIIYANARNLSYYNYDGKYANGTLVYGLPLNRNIPLIISLSKDTLKPVYNRIVNFNKGDIYSLFVTGRPDKIETVWIKDTIPLRNDSTTGVRFVHLSSDAGPLTVTDMNNTILLGLKYKENSSFRSYPAGSDISSYIFEVKNTETGELLTTFFYNDIGRNGNVTLIIRGVKNDGPEIEVVRMNHY